MSRMRRCDWCQKPFDEKVPRTYAEMEQVRVALFVTDSGAPWDRPICDICFNTVVHSAPRKNNNSSYDVGASNHGAPNVLLRMTAEGKT